MIIASSLVLWFTYLAHDDIYVALSWSVVVLISHLCHLRWLRVCLKAGWSKVFPEVVQFVCRQGRMKYIRPLYRSVGCVVLYPPVGWHCFPSLLSDLHKCPGGKELAESTFTSNRGIYHPIAIAMVTKDLGLDWIMEGGDLNPHYNKILIILVWVWISTKWMYDHDYSTGIKIITFT